MNFDNKFLPSQEAIIAFGNGGFRFGGYSHLGSLLILPSGMRAWQPRGIDLVAPADFALIAAEKNDLDFVLVGTGSEMTHLPAPVRAELQRSQIPFDCMSTSAAISTYNFLLADGRRVAAALIAVDDAHGR